MIREFNYTRRRRITARHVEIEMVESADGGASSFDANLHLDELQLPPDALLEIEASRERQAMRFRWGTVGNPQPPANRELSDLAGPPNFRVMALTPDSSRQILALANRITPQWNPGGETAAQELVHLAEEDLGQEVWRLDLGETGDAPVLKVNRNIDGISQAVRNDPAFRSLVFPEVLRSVLTQALLVQEADPKDDEGYWYRWFGFVNQFYPQECPAAAGYDPDTERRQADLREWIDGAVRAFTDTRFNASQLYAAARR